jgi:hypothetical protein
MGAMGLDCGALSKEKKCHLFFSARRRSPNIDQAAVQNEICVAAVKLDRFGVVGDGALIVPNIETDVAAIVEGDGTNLVRTLSLKSIADQPPMTQAAGNSSRSLGHHFRSRVCDPSRTFRSALRR